METTEPDSLALAPVGSLALRPRPNYLEIANAQLDRGLTVVPVHPFDKRGVLHNQFIHPATTVSEIMQHAKDFAEFNVGVVGRRGVGNHIFLDIDAKGVLEQIEAETGQILPLTFTVQSRPESKPWKRHYYFRQTDYSFQKFGGKNSKEINIKDLNKTNSKGKHPTLYDLKGCGGGGYVVAEGSVHPSGETYTILHDSPIIPIPDWLVDWIVQDAHRYRSERAKLAARRKTEVNKLSDKEKRTLQEAGVESAFEISADDIFEFMNSRAGSFASLGCKRTEIEKLLRSQIEQFCAGGREFVALHKDTIHAAAFNKRLKIGTVDLFKYAHSRGTPGIIRRTPLEIRRNTLEETIRRLPVTIAAHKAYDKLEAAVRGQELRLDRTKKADQQLVYRLRRKAGYGVRNVGGVQTWRLSKPLSKGAIQ